MEIEERRTSIYRFFLSFQRKRGIPPTFEEIRDHFGLSSKDMVSRDLKALEKAGLIKRQGKIARGITAVELALVSVPFLGPIAAGQPLPIPDPSACDECISVSGDLVGGNLEGVYAVRVVGFSMIDALIGDGDIVIFKAQRVADNGDLVGVWVKTQNAVTLKRFYQEGERIRLQPENPIMKPMYFAPEELEVQGKVLAVTRRSVGAPLEVKR